MLPDVTLRVDGVDYGGWQDVSVSMSIEELSNVFKITHTDRWANSTKRRPIRLGAQCSLFINDELLIDGFVDDIDPSYDARSHSLSVTGRDRTADIIDSSAVIKEFKNQKLDAIARTLCAPHSVDVTVDTNVGEPFKKQTVNPGESVYEVIERLARHRGLLLMSIEGDLHITKPGTELLSTKLVLGDNILRARPRFSHRQRFSEYTVLSQTQGDGSTWKAASTPKGIASDPVIRSTRRKLIVAEEPSTIAACNQRARWEANVSAGRSSQIVYTVEGWQHDGKSLWPRNVLVPVEDAYLDIDQPLLISGVNFFIGREGMLTDITVMPPQAFQLIPIPEDDQVLAWAS